MEGWLAAWPLLLSVFFLLCGFGIGGFMERSHLKRLDRKERELRDMVVCNLKRVPDLESAESSTMVMGQVVIATDYFKSFVTALRNLVGGEMKAANKLMNRGRREALMRLMEEAQRHGANEVYNVRFGFSSINQMNGRRGGAMQVEVLAWGTAVKRR
jgi:uncharacterized protein YbjQ (UPF0145 family)